MDAVDHDGRDDPYREWVARNYREEAAAMRLRQRRMLDDGKTEEAERLGRFIAAYIALGEMAESDVLRKGQTP